MRNSAATAQASNFRLIDFLALTKPRLNALVVVTTGVGYCLGVKDQFEAVTFFHTLIGSALVAGAAAALNQLSERDIDDTMERTRHRPIPSGRVQPWEACILAAFLAGLGLTELAIGANILASVVALVTLVSYIAIYTPLKRRTSWSTLIGAVPGALPPVIGWAAARGALGVEAWVLFGIVFLWQLPHFHALSWMYREDFRKANLPLMAVVDQEGRRTARQALLFTVVLLPVSLAPSLVDLTGRVYAGAAFGLGSAFLILAWRFAEHPSTLRARSLFIGSLVYLPLLWGLLVIDGVF